MIDLSSYHKHISKFSQHSSNLVSQVTLKKKQKQAFVKKCDFIWVDWKVNCILIGVEIYLYMSFQIFKNKDESHNKIFMTNCLSESSLQEIGHRKGFNSDSLGDIVTKMAVRETAMPESKCSMYLRSFNQNNKVL